MTYRYPGLSVLSLPFSSRSSLIPQIEIVNNSENQIGSFIPHIREDWIKNGNRIMKVNNQSKK